MGYRHLNVALQESIKPKEIKGINLIEDLSRPRSTRSGASWLFGYLCIREILVVTKSSVRPLMLADFNCHTY